LENYRAIRHELKEYSQELGERREILVVSKGELPEANELRLLLQRETGKPVLLISAVTGEGLAELNRAIVAALDAQQTERPSPAAAAGIRKEG
ncbi:MAG: GTPase ObgE, partial [Planctomycetota bacterium]